MTQQLELSTLKRDWIDRMESRVLAIDGLFTADKLHDLLETPQSLNWFGVLTASLKNRGLIQRVGYQPSKRPERNGAVIGLWVVVRPTV